MLFNQGGVTVQTAQISIYVLREHFSERLISLRGDLM